MNRPRETHEHPRVVHDRKGVIGAHFESIDSIPEIFQ